ncbi:MAG TPA: hypothetical protein VME43_16225 [Bryobacteraceae bacterium]|nr:hypothetical protein [Bryobacteraceae bacterium]
MRATKWCGPLADPRILRRAITGKSDPPRPGPAGFSSVVAPAMERS